MRKQLYEKYRITGFPIVQLLCDAVIVPTGAPHQVLNVHSAIKFALDFVDPETLGTTLDLTRQFAKLSPKHHNRPDLLQTVRIIYHTVQKCLTQLEQKEQSLDDLNQSVTKTFGKKTKH